LDFRAKTTLTYRFVAVPLLIGSSRKIPMQGGSRQLHPPDRSFALSIAPRTYQKDTNAFGKSISFPTFNQRVPFSLFRFLPVNILLHSQPLVGILRLVVAGWLTKGQPVAGPEFNLRGTTITRIIGGMLTRRTCSYRECYNSRVNCVASKCFGSRSLSR